MIISLIRAGRLSKFSLVKFDLRQMCCMKCFLFVEQYFDLIERGHQFWSNIIFFISEGLKDFLLILVYIYLEISNQLQNFYKASHNHKFRELQKPLRCKLLFKHRSSLIPK